MAVPGLSNVGYISGDAAPAPITVNNPNPTARGPAVYDPAKGGWIYPDGTPAPAPVATSQGWRPTPGKDVNGNPIPIDAYTPKPEGAITTILDGPGSPGSIGKGLVDSTGLNSLSSAGDILKGLGLGGGPAGAPINTGAISDASARAAALSQQYEAERQGYQPLAAPTAASQQIGSTVQAAAPLPIQVQLAQAAQAQRQGAIGAPTIQAERAGTQAPVGFDRITGAQEGRTTLNAPTLAQQAQLAPTALTGPASIDQAQQAQFRASQTGLVSGLQGAINGTDPSVAAIMLRQATDRNIANQYALAQAANGQNAGLAARQAAINAAEIGQQSIGQQALLRAQEIATARGQLGSVLDSGRGQDIGLAQQQAGLQQQANLANQGATNSASATQLGADVQTRLANAGFSNTANQTQAQLDAARAQFNATSANTAAQANQSAGLAAGTTNASLAQQVALANAAAGNNAATQNANNALQASTTNTTLAQQVALANAAAQTGVSTANANNATSANTASAQLANQVALANAASQNQTNQTNAQLGTQANIANAGNATTTNAQNITAKNDLAQNALTGSGQAITGAVGAASAQAEAQKAANQNEAAKLGAGATVAAALLSDRRAKTDIAPGSLDVGAFLRDLKAYNFKYKDPEAPGAAPGKRTGIMVQDLERNALGRSLVRETPGGKTIDVNQATGAALAALGELNKRVSKIEAR